MAQTIWAQEVFKLVLVCAGPAVFVVVISSAQHAPQGMVRPTSRMGANGSWPPPEVRAVAIGSRAQSEPLQPEFSATDRQWECEEGFNARSRPLQRPAIVGGRHPSRSGPMHPRHGLQAANSLGDGDVEEKRALESALSKAQKPAEELPVVRQIEVPKRERERHARSSVGRSTSGTPPEGSCAVSPDPANFHGVRFGSRDPEVAFPIGPDAGYERRRWQQICFVEREDCQTVCGCVRTHSYRPARPPVLDVRQVELRDAIEFGDQESILSLTGWGGTESNVPSMVTNVVSAKEHQPPMRSRRVSCRRSVQPMTCSNTQCQASAENTVGS